MRVCYLKSGNYFDKVVEVNAVPKGQNFVETEPPTLSEGEYARWWGFWQIVSEVLPEAPKPKTYRTLLTQREFFSSETGLTGQEQKAIRDYANDESKEHYGRVYELVAQLDASSEVDLTFKDTVEGMAYLVLINLLDQERHDSVMQGVEV